jgi:hypothetical protein
MRVVLRVGLTAVAAVAAVLMAPGVSTDANAKQLCRAPGVPKGCVSPPAANTGSSRSPSSSSYNSYDSRPKGHIIVPAPPGGRPIGHCYECIAPHYAWPPSGGAP